MKLISITILFFGFIVLNNNSFSQSDTIEHKIRFKPYIGLLPMDNNTFSMAMVYDREQRFVGVPATLGVATEFGKKGNKSFTFDVNFSYTGFKWSTYVNDYRLNEEGIFEYVEYQHWNSSSRKFRVMLGMNQLLKSNENYVTYFNVALGYKYINRVRIINEVKTTNIKYYIEKNGIGRFLSPIAFRLALGKKWTLTDKINFSMEIGLGGGSNPLQFGTEFKL